MDFNQIWHKATVIVPLSINALLVTLYFNSFTVSNALMRRGVVFCKWQQRINAFGAIFGFKKYQNDRHWHYIISTDCYTCTLTI